MQAERSGSFADFARNRPFLPSYRAVSPQKRAKRRDSASAEWSNGNRHALIAARRSFPPVGPFRHLQRGKALEAMTFLDGYYLLALDGTGYFSSTTIHCASCLHRVHRNGTITY